MGRWLLAVVWAVAPGCRAGGEARPDASGRPDAITGTPDARTPDARTPDAEPDASGTPDAAPDADPFPLAGFGAITGDCGVLGAAELTGPEPFWVGGDLDFGADRYDDPDDRPYLTPGGVEILLDGNAGGSSVYSEVFAYEVLQRCELAGLLKTETEIVYDVDGKKADLLVEIDGLKIGVSVTRAVAFPFGDPYTLEAATQLVERKLDDILVARGNASAADRWGKSLLAVLAYDAQHAATVRQAWDGLDAATRADSLVVTFATSGDDLFIYTDR